MRTRRLLITALFVGTTLVGAVLVGVGRSASAQPSPCQLKDAIGIPAATVGALGSAGAVEYRSSCPTISLHLPTPHAGDRFGSSITSADVNHDSYPDLLVGVPGYDVGSATDAGAVAVFLGSSTVPTFSTLLTQGNGGVPGAVQDGAAFGAAVNSWFPYGSDETDGYVSVVIGEPRKDVDGAKDAGGFVRLIYRNGTLAAGESTETTLDSPGIAGTAQAGDLLGSAVEGDATLIGAPGRTVSGHPGAGAVLAGHSLITQDSSCMAGVAETGDHFGASVAGLWIGAPDEDLGSARDAGLVERYGAASGSRGKSACFGLNQAVPGVSGSPETGDHFGAALAEIHGYLDDFTYNPYALLIGVPGEDTGTHRDSGFVNVIDESFDPGDMGAGQVRGDGSTAGPNLTGAAYGSSFGVVTDSTADVSGPGGTGLVYGVQFTRGKPLRHITTYRPAPTGTDSYPQNSYAVALTGLDY